ncbi:hypothetical protein HZ326_2835 [Fusarium oxysporum f. sp. albedinis]|nr:hypothetical protein HZ326_2835 [Fusarium oxysporum f. sp. albedinis]
MGQKSDELLELPSRQAKWIDFRYKTRKWARKPESITYTSAQDETCTPLLTRPSRAHVINAPASNGDAVAGRTGELGKGNPKLKGELGLASRALHSCTN